MHGDAQGCSGKHRDILRYQDVEKYRGKCISVDRDIELCRGIDWDEKVYVRMCRDIWGSDLGR